MPNYIVKYKDTITKYDNTNAGLFPPGLSIVCDKHGVVHLYVLEYPGLQCRYNMEGPVHALRVTVPVPREGGRGNSGRRTSERRSGALGVGESLRQGVREAAGGGRQGGRDAARG